MRAGSQRARPALPDANIERRTRRPPRIEKKTAAIRRFGLTVDLDDRKGKPDSIRNDDDMSGE